MLRRGIILRAVSKQQRKDASNCKKIFASTGRVIANAAPYRVDGEAGCFKFESHRRAQEDEVFFDNRRDFFPALQGEQWYLTRGSSESISDCQPQITAEQAVLIQPDLLRREAYSISQGSKPCGVVLVRIFGVNRFARLEFDAEL